MGINSLLDLGGPVVYILLLLSVYALAVILYKLHIFYKVEFFNNKNLSDSIDLWMSDKKKEAYDQLNETQNPESEVIINALDQFIECSMIFSNDIFSIYLDFIFIYRFSNIQKWTRILLKKTTMISI